jgi:hypothetical protein
LVVRHGCRSLVVVVERSSGIQSSIRRELKVGISFFSHLFYSKIF